MRKGRAEAFSDGVFAVAATVLVFNLIDPKVSNGLGTALLSAWPSYGAYVISFSTIVVIWVNHHAITDSIERFDRVLLSLNGLLLLTVAVIPFPTGLLAHYLQEGHDQTATAVAYGLTMTSMSVAFSIIRERCAKAGSSSDGAFGVPHERTRAAESSGRDLGEDS